MTESNIDAEQIKKTQDALGKYVKKPPLTEKLLKKPPFKFILDVVKAVSLLTHCTSTPIIDLTPQCFFCVTTLYTIYLK